MEITPHWESRTNLNHTSLRTAIFSLSIFLTTDEGREAFHRHGGVRLLAPFVANAPGKNTQLIYEATLCMWMCSLTRSTAQVGGMYPIFIFF